MTPEFQRAADLMVISPIEDYLKRYPHQQALEGAAPAVWYGLGCMFYTEPTATDWWNRFHQNVHQNVDLPACWLTSALRSAMDKRDHPSERIANCLNCFRQELQSDQWVIAVAEAYRILYPYLLKGL